MRLNKMLLSFINIIDFFLIFMIIYIIINLISSTGEQRILVFFIYFELIQLLLVVLLLFISSKTLLNYSDILIFSLFIIGVGGAETAIFLVIFIIYFRVTGLTTFKKYKKQIVSNI